MTANEKNARLRFDPDFKSVILIDGSVVSLTRLEGRVLEALIRNSQRVLTRGQILDAVTEPGSEKNDRNIDFIVNRLRRKLGDNARNPKFIASRYGEGYVWLGEAEIAQDVTGAEDAFLVVGPIRGLEFMPEQEELCIGFGKTLADELRGHLHPDQPVVVDPDFARSGPAEISVELTFFRDARGAECVISACALDTGKTLHLGRYQIGDTTDLGVIARNLAPILLAKVWKAETAEVSEVLPLPVAMYSKGAHNAKPAENWAMNDKRLKSLLADRPDDPSAKLMYATHLHAKYVTTGIDLFLRGEDRCREDEAEIERLVIESLDFAQSRPEYALMAAKLLHFVDKGYREFAMDLANSAHGSSTGIASSLATIGQLRSLVGDTEAGLESLRQAERLSEKGSSFRSYVLIILCQALIAAGRRDELAAPRKQVYAFHPALALFLEPLFTDPEKPSLRARAVAMMVSRDRATAIIRNHHYVSARLFDVPEQRRNAMQTPVRLFARRFGPGILPDDISASIPGLLD